MEKVLITGGAGFIGNAIIKQLYQTYSLVVMDNFSPQIHGENYQNSYLYTDLQGKCHLIKGDVCHSEDLRQALTDVDYVIHLAAETGTGQSMYELNKYTKVNIQGTSNLLETIIKNKLPVKKIILASSRSVYGEGLYHCGEHGIVVPLQRLDEDMLNGDFEAKCPVCLGVVELRLTTEECPLRPISYYAFTKLAQEKMLEVMCCTIDIPFTIFRYQNVYGAGQSLHNPYTGILSIFSKRLLKEQELNIFEDGLESRDFVHVREVAAVTCNALQNDATDNQIINVGSGERTSVLQVAQTLKRWYASNSKITISGDFRKGDIRHNIADITKAKTLCGYTPMYTFEQGMEEFTAWVKAQNKAETSETKASSFERSLEEMKSSGMLIRGRE